MGNLMNKQMILDADDLKTEDVSVPEWGGSVRLRTLTGGERDKFEADSMSLNKKGNPQMNLINMRARLVALCAIDDAGARMFADSEVTKLGSKSAMAINRLFDAARKLNGMTQEDVEELAEGFDEGQTE